LYRFFFMIYRYALAVFHCCFWGWAHAVSYSLFVSDSTFVTVTTFLSDNNPPSTVIGNFLAGTPVGIAAAPNAFKVYTLLDTGEIYSAPFSGTNSVNFVGNMSLTGTEVATALAMASDETTFYATTYDGSDSKVYKIVLSPFSSTQLGVTGTGKNLNGITIAGNTLYMTDDTANEIVSMPITGGSFTSVLLTVASPNAIAASPDGLTVFVTTTSPAKVYSVALSAPSLVLVGDSVVDPSFGGVTVALDGSVVFVTDPGASPPLVYSYLANGSAPTSPTQVIAFVTCAVPDAISIAPPSLVVYPNVRTVTRRKIGAAQRTTRYADLRWSAPTSGESPTGYKITRTAGGVVVEFSFAPTVFHYFDEDPPHGATYTITSLFNDVESTPVPFEVQ
jgi:hypothetical protein